jgi:hypothetical protein
LILEFLQAVEAMQEVEKLEKEAHYINGEDDKAPAFPWRKRRSAADSASSVLLKHHKFRVLLSKSIFHLAMDDCFVVIREFAVVSVQVQRMSLSTYLPR